MSVNENNQPDSPLTSSIDLNIPLAKYGNELQHYQSKAHELEGKLQDTTLVNNQKLYREVSIDYADTICKKNSLEAILKTSKLITDNDSLIHSESDPELIELINSEKNQLALQLAREINLYQELLIPKDPLDEGNAIIEIRAGTGGDEASLFAQEIFRAYNRYAEKMGLKVEVANISYSTTDGFKEVIFFVSGKNAFQKFRFESGVHRVQRVPVTENAGRIHTSTISIVVLPEIPEVELNIKDEDLRIDVYRSGGPGGQSVNTTDSAVRIVHLPSGITVTCQDEKSQLKNKAKAMKILTAKLYDVLKQEAEQKLGNIRQSAIKSGDRSDKIRTYNFPQSRVTDHRIKISWHNLSEIMEGDFEEIFSTVRREMAKLSEQSSLAE